MTIIFTGSKHTYLFNLTSFYFMFEKQFKIHGFILKNGLNRFVYIRI